MGQRQRNMVDEQRLSQKHSLPLCPTPESRRPLGARSVEQTILETTSKIGLATLWRSGAFKEKLPGEARKPRTE